MVGVAVGVAGFEPTASSSRTKRATKLRHTPPEATPAYRTGRSGRQTPPGPTPGVLPSGAGFPRPATERLHDRNVVAGHNVGVHACGRSRSSASGWKWVSVALSILTGMTEPARRSRAP